jgi:hypothetical protein
MTADFIYVRSPAAAPFLAPASRSSYEVCKRADKFFILKIGGRFEAVTLD